MAETLTDEPVYTDTTERLYRRLPEFLRTADSRQDWILKHWISSIADSQGDLDLLIARLDYLPGGPPSALVDPDAGDERWLEWMGQLVGVRPTPGLSVQERRDAVRSAASGFRAGTKSAVAEAARSALTGTKHVEVYDHSSYSTGDGGPWDVLLVTRASETPDVEAVLRTVIAKRAKPAGVMLWHRAYGTSWGTLETNFPTWAAWKAAGSWTAIQESGLTPFTGRPYGSDAYGEGVYG